MATEHVNNLAFSFKAGEFFQNNPFALVKLVDFVIDHAAVGTAKKDSNGNDDGKINKFLWLLKVRTCPPRLILHL